VLKGAALVIPAGLLKPKLSEPTHPGTFAEDPHTRAETERLSMAAVMAAERALGHEPRDVSGEKKGWDIESRDGKFGHLRFIEVKGRHVDARDIILTKNELLAALNAPESYYLAIVAVENGFAHQPKYLQRFFNRELGFAETAVVFNIADILSLENKPL